MSGQIRADSGIEQFACDEGLGDGSACAGGEHLQGVAAGGVDGVDLGSYREFFIDDNTEVLGVGDGVVVGLSSAGH